VFPDQLEEFRKMRVTPIVHPGNREVGEEVMGSNLFVRTKDYHDPCAGSAKPLRFFIHTIVECGMSFDREHIIVELSRLLYTIGVKVPLSHHQNQLL